MTNHEVSISFLSHADPRRASIQADAIASYRPSVISVYEDLGFPGPFYQLSEHAKRAHMGDFKVGAAGYVVPKHPTMDALVGEVAILDNLSEGRAYAGFVPGAWMDKIGKKQASVEQMREAVGSFNYLLQKRTDGFEGQHYQVAPGFALEFDTPDKVPILLGAWGPKMLALAGEVADEVKIGGSANPSMVAVAEERLKPGLEKSGRILDQVGIVFGAVTVVDEDRDVALSLAKRKAAVYIDAIGDKDPEILECYVSELSGIRQAMKYGDVKTAVGLIDPRLLRKFMFAGTPADIIQQTEELFAAGATRVEYGSPHGVDELGGLKLLGDRVFPHFKGGF